MDNTHEIRANYHITFHVVVENPDGELLNVWRAQGESVALETPSILDREDEKERLSFNGWQGAEIEAPKGTVNGGVKVGRVGGRLMSIGD